MTLVEVTSVVLRPWGVPDGAVDPQFSHKEHSYQFHGICYIPACSVAAVRVEDVPPAVLTAVTVME